MDFVIFQYLSIVFDAWGKIPPGVFSGNIYELGNFEQCLDTIQPTSEKNLGSINGQYCLMPVKFNIQEILNATITSPTAHDAKKLAELYMQVSTIKRSTITFGICVPAICEPTYIIAQTNVSLKELHLEIDHLNPHSLCTQEENIKLDGKDIAMIVILTIIILLMIISTGYDVITKRLKHKQNMSFLAFSAVSHGKKLFSIKKTNHELECLNGIRVLSIIWVIYGHVYYCMALAPFINSRDVVKWNEQYSSMLVLSASVVVDTFLLLTGLLLTWYIFIEFENGKRLNIPLMYIHRYLRLTPSYAVLILFSISLFRYMGYGPLRKVIMDVSLNNCGDYWWSALLYIQNYYNPSNICIPQSWYLSVDTQFFIISPLIIIPLWKWRKTTTALIISVIMFLIGYVYYLYYSNHFDFKITSGVVDTKEVTTVNYASEVRIGSWLVGVLLGSFLHKHKDEKLIIPKYVVVFGWIVSLATMLAVVFGPYNIQQMFHKDNMIENSIFGTFRRLAWTIGLGILIILCVHGYGGILSTMLSHRLWKPIARLTYSMYLIHILVIFNRMKSIKNSQFFDDYVTMRYFVSDLIITIILSFFWTLAFESPIVVVEKLIFKRQGENIKESSLDKAESSITDDIQEVLGE